MAESTSVTIENIEKLADFHECKSGQTLMDIKISVVRLEESSINQSACMQELTSRFEEQSRQIQQVLYSRHECYSHDEIKRQAIEIDFLKSQYHQGQGKTRIQERIDKAIDGLIVLVIGAVLIFLLKGGSIV
jgi:hypothetical protein